MFADPRRNHLITTKLKVYTGSKELHGVLVKCEGSCTQFLPHCNHAISDRILLLLIRTSLDNTSPLEKDVVFWEGEGAGLKLLPM